MDSKTTYKNFVVAYDFSEHSKAALYAAADLADHFDAVLHLVHVVQMPALAYPAMAGVGSAVAFDVAPIRAGAREALDQVAVQLRERGSKVETHVGDGTSIDHALCDLARSLDADLLVMGTHGRTGIAHAFLGSVAERTLRRAPCPVLTVRGPGETEE